MRLALGRQIGAFGLITTSNVHLGQARQVRKQGSNPWSKIDNQKNYLACTENVLADTYRAESITHRWIDVSLKEAIKIFSQKYFQLKI